MVSEKDFLRSKAKAKADQFWSENPVEMRFKTLVHRVTSKLAVDPAKVNASFAAVEADENQAFERDMAEEIKSEAHTEVLQEGKVPEVDHGTGEIQEENQGDGLIQDEGQGPFAPEVDPGETTTGQPEGRQSRAPF